MKKRSKTRKPAIKEVFRLLFSNFFEHDVGKNAAALAYYLLFALFPLLIFVSNLLGILDLNVYAVIRPMKQILPGEIVGLIETYLDYISNTSSHILMWFALIFSIWFPMRAAKGLMDDVRLAYGLGRPRSIVAYTIRQLICTVLLLVAIILTLVVSTAGEHILIYISRIASGEVLKFFEYLIGLWEYLRFLLVAVLMFLAIGTLYAFSPDKMQPLRAMLPGIVAALLLWLAVSVGFSFYVDNFANYTVIYGTLGAVMMLMIWLYLSAGILIMGAELNAVLQTVRSKNEDESFEK